MPRRGREYEIERVATQGRPRLEGSVDDAYLRVGRKIPASGEHQVGADFEGRDPVSPLRQGDCRLSGGAADLQHIAGGVDTGALDELVEQLGRVLGPGLLVERSC